jgi:hypothetical protein
MIPQCRHDFGFLLAVWYEIIPALGRISDKINSQRQIIETIGTKKVGDWISRLVVRSGTPSYVQIGLLLIKQ